MIDLTPLDVRNKRGDFKKGMRGYDPQEVDVFLELVAERLEALVRENIQLRDRTQALQEQVDAQSGREQAVQDALVTAQELRKDIREQSQREADHVLREAESEARRIVAEAEAEVRSRLRGVERQMDQARDSLQELERRRARFLQDFGAMLRRELDFVEVEEGRTPLDERMADLDLGIQGPDTAPPLDDDVGDLATREEASKPEAPAEEPAAEPAEAPVDVADLQPGGTEQPIERGQTGEADVEGQPSSLELELMAGAGGAEDGGTEESAGAFPDVPDLETVLAEAGIDDVRPPAGEEISPPPAEERPVDVDDRRPEDRLAFFDKDDEKKR